MSDGWIGNEVAMIFDGDDGDDDDTVWPDDDGEDGDDDGEILDLEVEAYTRADELLRRAKILRGDPIVTMDPSPFAWLGTMT
jgi:hypothetical protein